jgi:hypothetical protein
MSESRHAPEAAGTLLPGTGHLLLCPISVLDPLPLHWCKSESAAAQAHEYATERWPAAWGRLLCSPTSPDCVPSLHKRGLRHTEPQRRDGLGALVNLPRRMAHLALAPRNPDLQLCRPPRTATAMMAPLKHPFQSPFRLQIPHHLRYIWKMQRQRPVVFPAHRQTRKRRHPRRPTSTKCGQGAITGEPLRFELPASDQ